jgi:predicted nucleic acid-binding protein
MIADTSAWVELFRGTGSAVHLRLRQALQSGEALFMPDPVYQELLQGARSPEHFVRLQSELDTVRTLDAHDSREVARQGAMLSARCRWQGVTIRSPNDCLIAAWAIESGEPLLHADRDFLQLAQIDNRLQLL